MFRTRCTRIRKSYTDNTPSTCDGCPKTCPKHPISRPPPTRAVPVAAGPSSKPKQAQKHNGTAPVHRGGTEYFFRRCLTGATRDRTPPLQCSELDARGEEKVTRATRPQHATAARKHARNTPFRAPRPHAPFQWPPTPPSKPKQAQKHNGTAPARRGGTEYFFRRCLTGATRDRAPPLQCSELDARG
jgi:hypothetical protein